MTAHVHLKREFHVVELVPLVLDHDHKLRVSAYGALIIVSCTFFVVNDMVCVYVVSFFQSSPPQIVQEKILSLIQDWADAFRGSPDLSYVMETYESLRAQGLNVFALFGVVFSKAYLLQL